MCMMMFETYTLILKIWDAMENKNIGILVFFCKLLKHKMFSIICC